MTFPIQQQQQLVQQMTVTTTSPYNDTLSKKSYSLEGLEGFGGDAGNDKGVSDILNNQEGRSGNASLPPAKHVLLRRNSKGTMMGGGGAGDDDECTDMIDSPEDFWLGLHPTTSSSINPPNHFTNTTNYAPSLLWHPLVHVPSSPAALSRQSSSNSPLTIEKSLRLLLAESPSMQAEKAKWAFACENNNIKRGSPAESSLLGNSILGRSRSNSMNKEDRDRERDRDRDRDRDRVGNGQPGMMRRGSRSNIDHHEISPHTSPSPTLA